MSNLWSKEEEFNAEVREKARELTKLCEKHGIPHLLHFVLAKTSDGHLCNTSAMNPAHTTMELEIATALVVGDKRVQIAPGPAHPDFIPPPAKPNHNNIN